MNILITNDDGPNTLGLQILRETVKRVWPGAKVVVIVPDKDKAARGLSVTPMKLLDELILEETAVDEYILRGTPADVIYVAFCRMSRFLSAGRFDLVISGINHGANVGLSILHSGTVGQCMMATALFNCQSLAFSQDLGLFKDLKEWSREELQDGYNVSSKLVGEYLRAHFFMDVDCRNVNFPKGPAVKAFVITKPAPYHTYLDKQILDLPNTKYLKDDVQLLSQGYATVSELSLSIIPPLG